MQINFISLQLGINELREHAIVVEAAQVYYFIPWFQM